MLKTFLNGLNYSPSLLRLYYNRIFHLVGMGLLGLFVPIFLFEKFNYSYYLVILFYIGVNLLPLLTVPIGAMIMNKISLKYSMIVGTVCVIIHIILYYCYENYSWLGFLIILIIIFTGWRILYWIPFHTDFVKFSTKRQRGQQSSVFKLLSDVLGIIVPIAAGLILYYYNYSVLFIISII